jgi:outer membrane protein assembly factor BamB
MMKSKRAVLLVIANIAVVLSLLHGTSIYTLSLAKSFHPEALAPIGTGTENKQASLTSDFLGLQEVAGSALTSLPANTTEEADWPMAGANPQRTSWSPEEVPGKLEPVWYRPIEAYIAPKIQIIASNDLLYISTARGLYALYTGTGDGDAGQVAWVYPTELPLGHSPTIHNGVAYVGGLDRKLHAINALTGQGLWTFEAEAGFQTNPLVVDSIVYAGSRDGYMYAIYADDHPNKGTLAWKYKTDGPILFSAAYQDNTIYFASNDSHAYALNAATGGLVWKSSKLLGSGFHSWWPVVYQDPASGVDVVIFAGSNNYRFSLDPAHGWDLQNKERDDIFPDKDTDPSGTPFGARLADGSVDATRALQYYEEKPWRRTYFVLNRATGQEVTFDFDGDGKPEYAPMLWQGTHSGTRFPPVVGADGKIYQAAMYMSNPYIAGSQVIAWQVGDSSIETPMAVWKALDEPLAYSAGGNLIYWNHCNDRSAGAFDLSIPNTHFYPEGADPSREWVYWAGPELESLIPGYNVLYEGTNPSNYVINNLFKGPSDNHNGVYGQHGDQNAPVPYKGTVYVHRSNSIIALSNYDGAPTALSMVTVVPTEDATSSVTTEELKQKLVEEVQKILDAGHLRPGYRSVGLFDGETKDEHGDYLIDYWHYPSDTLFTLLLALPHLPTDMQNNVKTYLQNEYANYPPHEYTHIGWQEGTARELFTLPAETEADRENHPPDVSGFGYEGWTWPPNMFYALWKYAEVFGSATEIFDDNKDRLEDAPSDDYLLQYPYVHNAYIAGYIGYLELESLAGYAESPDIKAELNRLLNLRATTFSKDIPYPEDGRSIRALSVARNFMFLVPELGQYLNEHALAEVQGALDEYGQIAPYWFVSNFEATHGEGATQHLFDYHGIFLAKAWIMEESRGELAKYLDVPAMQVGDFFYIQNLVAAIEAGNSLDKEAFPHSGDQGDSITYTLKFWGTGETLTLIDTLPEGISAPISFELEGTSVTPSYDGSQHRLTWSDTPADGQEVTIRYVVTITTDESRRLVNIVELSIPGGLPSTDEEAIMANPYRDFLPLAYQNN